MDKDKLLELGADVHRRQFADVVTVYVDVLQDWALAIGVAVDDLSALIDAGVDFSFEPLFNAPRTVSLTWGRHTLETYLHTDNTLTFFDPHYDVGWLSSLSPLEKFVHWLYAANEGLHNHTDDYYHLFLMTAIEKHRLNKEKAPY